MKKYPRKHLGGECVRIVEKFAYILKVVSSCHDQIDHTVLCPMLVHANIV
jgi:hypothetical protein